MAETYTPDSLVLGQAVTDTVTIKSGQTLTRGALLGRVDADGKFILSVDTATDGSQTPAAILLDETVDASGGDKTASVYVAGVFDETSVVFGGAHTADSVRWGLHARGIHLQKTV